MPSSRPQGRADSSDPSGLTKAGIISPRPDQPPAKSPARDDHPSPLRPAGFAEIAAVMARIAPAVLRLVADEVVRPRSAIVAAFTGRHAKEDVVRILVRLTVAGRWYAPTVLSGAARRPRLTRGFPNPSAAHRLSLAGAAWFPSSAPRSSSPPVPDHGAWRALSHPFSRARTSAWKMKVLLEVTRPPRSRALGLLPC
jgi:hypothetical protein